jgi:hypothetical protein
MNDQPLPLPSTEREIVDSLLARVQQLGENIIWAREARSHGRARTDVLLMRDAEVITIEVKRSDWKRAVLQAVLNRYCADRSFIALWASHVTDEVLEEAGRRGLGVLAVGPESLQVLGEAPIAQPDPAIRNRLLLQLPGVGTASIP